MPRKSAKRGPTPTIRPLTDLQARFVEEYIVDLNASQAAIRAGYSEDTAGSIGHENLKKPEIAFAIIQAMQERSERTKITADRVLLELGVLAFSDMRKFATWGPSGVTLSESVTLDEDAARCVAEISETPSKAGKALRFKLHSKTSALEQIAKHLGMFGGVGGGDVTDVAKLTDEQLGEVRRKLKLA